MNRRTFMFLLFVAALCELPKGAAAAPTCRECGRTIWRGSRATRLDALPPMPEAELCLQCLAALPGDEYDLIPDDGPDVLVRIEGRNWLPGTAWISKADFRNWNTPRSPYRVRLVRDEPMLLEDIIDLATAHLERRTRPGIGQREANK